jgi:hypothetical protein
MGIGSNRAGAALFTALLLTALSFAEASALERNTGIWKLMREGGFQAPMNEDAHVWPLGNIDVGRRHYWLVDYEWLETKKNMRGSSPHGRTGLLVFERARKGLIYLGGYDTPGGGRPHIEGRTVVFPYRDYEIHGVMVPSKTIVFDEKGPPPKAYLDAENFTFGK